MMSASSDSKEVKTEPETDEKDVIKAELLEIEELDASIHDLQLKIEEISNELTELQIKNREKLKQMLLSSPPECRSLAKNTQLFLNLYSNDDRKESCDYENLQLPAVVCDSEEHSDSDEENQELENQMNDDSLLSEVKNDCLDEKSDNCGKELNPFSLDDESDVTSTME